MSIDYIKRSCIDMVALTMKETRERAEKDVAREVKSGKHQKNARGAGANYKNLSRSMVG